MVQTCWFVKWSSVQMPFLKVCVPELILNQTRRDWRAIPELAGPGQDYFFMVPLLGENPENKGLLSTNRESLE